MKTEMLILFKIFIDQRTSKIWIKCEAAFFCPSPILYFKFMDVVDQNLLKMGTNLMKMP